MLLKNLFNHSCQQYSHNLRLPDFFKIFIQYFSPNTYLAHGFWHIIHKMVKLPQKIAKAKNTCYTGNQKIAEKLCQNLQMVK